MDEDTMNENLLSVGYVQGIASAFEAVLQDDDGVNTTQHCKNKHKRITATLWQMYDSLVRVRDAKIK